MKNKTTAIRSSLPLPVILLVIVMFSGFFFNTKPFDKQYSPEPTPKAIDNKKANAYQYFFNARRNIMTNSMDYGAMLKTSKQIEKTNRNHKAMSAMGLFWKSLGPDNVGAETRAILIDNRDPSGQTIFAGCISGGLWKSTDGGATWDTTATNLSNGCVSCIAQDLNGNIFIGTGDGFSQYLGGEGFNTAELGGGIFESKDDGATFNALPATVPSSANNGNATWAYTNRIAIPHNNPNLIYAATSSGLMVSRNAGASFSYATNTSGHRLSVNSLDVKASLDGKIVVACVGGNGFYLYPSSANDTAFTEMHQSGRGKLPSSNGNRIEFAISPTNSNYVYASVITKGTFDNPGAGIFMTMSAVDSGNGGYWYEIGQGGSLSFDPYSNGVQDQGTYDNTIGVFPNNPGRAIIGGVTLWLWAQTSPSDTMGGWAGLSSDAYDSIGTPTYIHPDDHVIAIDANNSDNVYIGCDGGIYKSSDGANTFQKADTYYDATQFYSVAFAPYVNTNGEGILGGTQDNGNQYISGNNYHFQDGVDLTGSNGGQCALSTLNPNIYFVTTTGGNLMRSCNLSNLFPPVNSYTSTTGLNTGADIESVSGFGSGCYVTPLVLYENPYDTTTLDSLLWVADNSYNAGDTVYPYSPNGYIQFPYKLNKPVSQGDTIKVQNRVISKIATAFSASNGVWITMQASNFNDHIIWMPIGGPQSKPDAFTGSDPVHCMAFSPNGDALFVGTEEGQFYRFSNLDSIIDTSYITGGIYSIAYISATPVVNPYTRVKSTSLTSALGVSGRDILSIAIDPNNGNNMLVTVGNYNETRYVFHSNNALSASPIFTSVQGNLPAMPVYGSILDVINSPYPNGAVIATEHGVWSTTDVTAASPSWTECNTGTANTIVLAIKQQTLPPWNCNNSGKIYIGTDGRGIYVDSSFYVPAGINQVTAANQEANIKVYPNPMNSAGTIAFTLPECEKVTLTIYGINGKLIKEIPVASQAPGLHTVSINSEQMPVGAYLATVTGTDFRQTTRFVVTR